MRSVSVNEVTSQPVLDQSTAPAPTLGRVWELWLLGALAAIAPFNLTVGIEPWTALRIRPLVVVGIGVSLLLAARVMRGRARSGYDFVDLCCAWWLVGVWLAALTSEVPVLGSGGATRVSLAVLLVFVTRALVRDAGSAAFVLRSLAIGCAAGALLGLVLWSWSALDTTTWFVGQVTTVANEPRLTHPWGHANVAAMAIVASAAGLATLRNRPVALALLGGLVIALALTASRGGLLAAAMMALAWLWARRSAREALAVLALIVIAGFTIATTDVWGARINSDVTQLGYSAQVEVSDRIVASGEPIPIVVTNDGSAEWQHQGEQQALVSARWLDDQGLILAEDWWQLPATVSAGESLQMQVAMEPRAPVGVYQVHWDMIIPNVVYFSESAAAPPTLSNVVVAESSITADAVARYAQARSRVQLGRLDAWHLAWDEFNDSPMFGVGPNQFGISAQSADPEMNRVAGSHAHNVVLQPLVGWGLVGALPFFLIVGLALVRVRPQLGQRASRNAAILRSAVAAVLTHGLVDWPLVSVSTCIPVGIVLGLATSRGDIR